MQLTMFSNLLDLSLKGADPVPDLPAIQFQLRLARPAGADSTAEAG